MMMSMQELAAMTTVADLFMVELDTIPDDPFGDEPNFEKFSRHYCSICQDVYCAHQSRMKVSGRHYPAHGSQKYRNKK